MIVMKKVLVLMLMSVIAMSIMVPTTKASEKKEDTISFDINKDSKKELRTDDGVLTVEKDNRLRLKDAIYTMYWKSFDGNFNVGFSGVIADNQFIDIYDEWTQFRGLRLLDDELAIKSAKKAVYSVYITDGWQSWTKNMVSSIDWLGNLNVTLK